MKKIVLSVIAVSALAVTGAYADSSSDIAEMKAMMKQMNQRLAKLEAENKQLKAKASKKKKTSAHKTQSKHVASNPVHEEVTPEEVNVMQKYAKATPVFAKTSKLKFSGRHYLGFINQTEDMNAYNFGPYSAPASSETYNYFSTRRNYLQVKGYFFEDPESYMRVTLDTHQIPKGVPNAGDWEVRLKYAYLFINDILPYTGVEFGQAHRPWIDYEEHHGWYYRSIAKTFAESKGDTDFTNSADLGINFKTKMEYFSSEIGLFNGEGYHGLLDKDENNGLSFEWRLTANLLGTGEKHVHKSDTYADASFYGQYNKDYSKKGEIDPLTGEAGDFVWYGINAVYNQPEFLINADYIKSDKASINYKGEGWSVNGEFRLETISGDMKKWNTIARYDYYELDAYDEARKAWLAGITYTWNKNVEFILNYTYNEDPRLIIDGDTGTQDDVVHAPQDDKFVMFTADVKW